MQTTLRRMGNSTGIILPKAVLREMDVAVGMAMDIRVEDGKVIATPCRRPRHGWAEDAERVGAEPLTDEEREWMAFGNDGDDELTW